MVRSIPGFTPRERWILALLATAWLLAVATSDRSVETLASLTVSIGGAAGAVVLARRDPLGAFAILFALAAISRVTVELPPGTMRLEQPAIAAVALWYLPDAWRRRRELLSRDGLRSEPLRPVGWIVAALALYLFVLGVSSLLVAPAPLESVRLMLWHALSIIGGAVAFLLLRGRSTAVTPAIVWIGAAAAALGVFAAIAFYLLGPTFDLGIQGISEGYPRVYALAWEGNLYASFLGALLPFALERFRIEPSAVRAFAVGLICVGFGLAITRGAYIGLAAGLGVQAIALGATRGPVRLAAPAAVLAVGLVLAALSPSVLLSTSRGEPGVLPTGTPATTRPGGSGVNGSSSTAAEPTPTPTPTPTPSPYPDTVGFRLARIGPAIDDMKTSPLIGLGADSFGQRHADSSQAGAPDHLGFLGLVIPYESGIVGTIGFVAAWTVLFWLLVRALRDGPRRGLAAAFLGSLVSLAVAYQATNAIHFAINWLLGGAALALAIDARAARNAVAAAEPGVGR